MAATIGVDVQKNMLHLQSFRNNCRKEKATVKYITSKHRLACTLMDNTSDDEIYIEASEPS